MPGLSSPDQQAGIIPEEDKALEKAPEALHPEAATSNDVLIKPSEKIVKVSLLDPEVEYQKALIEIHQEMPQDHFEVFSKHINPENYSVTPEAERTRTFTGLDKIRHKGLEVLARFKGVKDIEGFNSLVEYFETTFIKTTSLDKSYNAGISYEEKNRIIQEWRTKGFRGYFGSSFEKGKIKFHMLKDSVFNVGVDNIPVIKKLLETGVDAIPLFKALEPQKRFNSYFLESYQLKSSSSEATKFIELLQDPNLEQVLPLIRGMDSLPHENWELRQWNGEKTQIDELSAVAKEVDISIYTPEFFEKAGVLARSLGRRVKVAELPAYYELINNPDKLEFLAVGMEAGVIPSLEQGFSVFDSLNALEQDKLLSPLTILINSGVTIEGSIFETRRSYEASEVPKQRQLNQNLLQFLAKPAVRTVLFDKEKQAFAKVLRKMAGVNVPASLVAELYPARKELVTINNLIFSSLDGKYGSDKYMNDSKLEVLKTLVYPDELKNLQRTQYRREILVSPEFQVFIDELKGKGILIQPQNFFQYENDIFDGSRKEPLLIQLFKARELFDLIDPNIPKRIIESIEDRYLELDWLSTLVPYIDTITLLKKYGVPLDLENFKNADWIKKVNYMSLKNFYVFSRIPEDKKGEWLKAIINLPEGLQDSIAASAYDKNHQNIINSEYIDRVLKLSNILSSSDFFLKELSGRSYWELMEVYEPLGQYKGDVDLLFTDNKPNAQFAKLLIEQKKPRGLFLVLRPDIWNSFEGDSPKALREWGYLDDQLRIKCAEEIDFPDIKPEIMDRYRMANDIKRFAHTESLSDSLVDICLHGDYKSLFTGFGYDRRPSRILIDAVIRTQDYQLLTKLLSEEVLSQYNSNERSVFITWQDLPDDLRRRVIQEYPNFPDIPLAQAEKYRVAGEATVRIKNSSSAEIKRLETEIVQQLWQTENPKYYLDRIIEVFEKNNLPYVGKVYRVFEILHHPAKFQEKIDGKKNILSPILVNADNSRRYAIIYRDLLKVAIDSGNPSLLNFLQTLQSSQQVIDEVEQHGAGVLEGKENSSKREQAIRFLNRMDVLYANSQFGRRKNAQPTIGLEVQERVIELKRNLGIDGNQRLLERVSSMFLRPLGFRTIQEALEQMALVKKVGGSRNIQYAKEALEEAKSIVIHEGDLLKGINTEFLENILLNGSLAKEYLGASADSDHTPFDTDVTRIMVDQEGQDLKTVIANSKSSIYGELLLVFRDRGQFQNSREEQSPHYSSNKYELFFSGVASSNHYGIRTGIASTEIDVMIAKDSLTSNEAEMQRIYFTIAQNGFYIPVVNVEGKIIFTPEMYEEYKVKNEEVRNILDKKDFTPSELIQTLKKSPFMQHLYESSVGVWEGYTLDQHTLMAMGQYEKYFADRWKSPLISQEGFRMMLSLHDLGKPLSVQIAKTTSQQHEYTMKFLPGIIQGVGFKPQEMEVMVAIANQDYLGEYLQGHLTGEDAAESIRDAAQESGIPVSQFFELLKMYFMCDAGAYTEDAGGSASLDRLFVFRKPDTNLKGQASLSEETQKKIDEISRLLQT